MIKMEEQLKVIAEGMKKVSYYINYFEDIGQTYSDPNGDIGDKKITIDRFMYNEEKENWRIRIVNQSDIDFRNVDVFKVETREKMCTFAIIQQNCIVWKDIKLEYGEDLYGLHLIAISKGIIISDNPFLIAPYKLSNPDNRGVDGDDSKIELLIKLKNCSMKLLPDLCLAIPNEIEPMKFENSNIGYLDTTELWVPLSSDRNYNIFAYSGDTKITPDLQLILVDGNEIPPNNLE